MRFNEAFDHELLTYHLILSDFRYDATSRGRIIERFVVMGSPIRDDVETAMRLDTTKQPTEE